MILSATMLQLGKKQVSRILPANPVTVTEVETTVVRCLVYRDQYPHEWNTIEKHPVKTIMGFDFLRGIEPSMVLDVWDRQYLTKQFHKARPDQAEIYSVTFRLTQDAAKIFLEANTEAGLFIEPREPHGRSPHSAFKVVWLPKLGFKETVTAQQQTKQASSIARSGDRFGLRVAASEVQAVHSQHRPDIAYLDTSMLRQFRISPLPYGTTKQNLQKVCSEWKWQARPSHSVGLHGTAGLAWIVEAVENPAYWLWTMAHGDVLISEITPAKPAQVDNQRPAIVASQRTLRHISHMQAPASGASGGDPNDPWKNWDPWKKQPEIAPTSAFSHSQIARLEANMDKKIQEALQTRPAPDSQADDPMNAQVDSRVSQLEHTVTQLKDNLNQLSGSVNTFQQKQQSHNQQVAQQFQTVQTQLEGQNSHMQKIVDNAMDEQMRRIEALLAAPSSKVARTGEWQHPYTQNMHARSNKIMWHILICVTIIRIGEALHPGPMIAENEVSPAIDGLTIGAINPTGILKKAATFALLPSRQNMVWGICETHLTQPGCRKFRTELQCCDKTLSFYPGAATPFRSASQTAIGGTHQGTGFVTNMPSRRLQPTWSDDQWSLARFTMNTFLCGSTWIHGAVMYGYAFQATTSRVQKQTDDLLSIATTKIVQQMVGMRFIMGDFNQEEMLPQTNLWRHMGWKEVQLLRQEHTGQEVEPTCKATTTKDFIWISPELQPFFHHLDIVPHIYPDHSAICAHFLPFGKIPKIYHWHQPHSLPWNLIQPQLQDGYFQKDDTLSPEDQCKSIGIALEQRVSSHLKTSDQPTLLSCQKGRCATTKTVAFVPFTKPVKPSRQGDVTPSYTGMSLQHARWFTQLRRLVSLLRLYDKPCWTLKQNIHAWREWRAILRCPGFPKNFQSWWVKLESRRPQAPTMLPNDLPTKDQLHAIHLTFEAQFRHLEKTLQSTFNQKAKSNRLANPNQVFRDFGKTFAHPVQILDHSKRAKVVEVRSETGEIILDSAPGFSDKSVAGANGLFQPLHVCEETLWVDPSDVVPVGTWISQEDLIGDLDAMFKQFSDEWTRRWNRHRDLPSCHWDELLSFITQVTPPQPQQALPPITREEWIATLKRKKKTSTGPDGLSREDLLKMPSDITQAILDILNQIEVGTMTWPSQWVTGIIHLLEKVPGAATTAQFRPITLFSLVYRVWASIRTSHILAFVLPLIPSHCYGSIPGRSAQHMWMNLQCLIEESYEQNLPVSGGVADIQKCFNHLPRIPILGLLVHLGIDKGIVRAWGQALCTMRRRFNIRQSKGPEIFSHTGFAEGCPLSIIAMIGANLMIDKWVSLRAPEASLWSYVDNLEITSHDAATTLHGFKALETILQILDLPVDASKSYVWANNATDRKWFSVSQHKVAQSCKDLGGQMQYTRKSFNYVITSRIEQFKPRWKQLSSSPAGYRQKLLALRSVAWANVLHGAPSAHLGPKHFDGLRTQALRAIHEHGAGVSPIVHLSLVEHPSFDPEFAVLMTTLLHCRQCLNREQVSPLLTQLGLAPPRKRPSPGPCSVLFHRLASIHWNWDPLGFFTDHEGIPIDIWDHPIQWVKLRLKEGWQVHVCQLTSNRKTFVGMEHTHAAFTCEKLTAIARDAAFLRNALNGAFFTADHLHQRDPEQGSQCHHCGQEDNIHHRNWICPALQQARDTMSQEDQAAILAMEPATHNHGWFPLPLSVKQLQKQLQSVTPFPAHQPIDTSKAKHVHFFTDGACPNPGDSFTRITMWGVVAFTDDALDTPKPVCNGVLPGMCQTVVRAELKAVIEALCAAWTCQLPFSLWIDNQLVYDRLRYLQNHPDHTWPSKVKNHDLLNSLSNLMHQCSGLLKHVTKVCSHQQTIGASDPVETWAFQGNDAADGLANSALSSHLALVTCWTQATTDINRYRTLRDSLHAMLVQIGLASMTKQSNTPVDITCPIPAVVPQHVTMEPWFFPLDHDCHPNYRLPRHEEIIAWNHGLHLDEGVPQRWSWWELYIDICFVIPSFAPAYSIPRNKWIEADVEGIPFLKRTKSFARYIHRLASQLGVELPARHTRPQTCHITWWTKTLPVRVPLARSAAIDQWLGRFISGVTKTSDLSVVP